ncbi:hypothetical protein ACI2L1_16655 [Streptomyces sp. NPDC019531]|uniref:hypothetical protein n=1 Tax=Streptomyces sp. NPDC019531 TaxID=3365062 RepID=UPI00384D907F
MELGTGVEPLAGLGERRLFIQVVERFTRRIIGMYLTGCTEGLRLVRLLNIPPAQGVASV